VRADIVEVGYVVSVDVDIAERIPLRPLVERAALLGYDSFLGLFQPG
jgi:hypothetical protein